MEADKERDAERPLTLASGKVGGGRRGRGFEDVPAIWENCGDFRGLDFGESHVVATKACL